LGARARLVVDHVASRLSRYIDDPEKGNAFEDRYGRQASSLAFPSLLLELFEEHDDAEAVGVLKKLEDECF
jgi:hypothetical protein